MSRDVSLEGGHLTTGWGSEDALKNLNTRRIMSASHSSKCKAVLQNVHLSHSLFTSSSGIHPHPCRLGTLQGRISFYRSSPEDRRVSQASSPHPHSHLGLIADCRAPSYCIYRLIFEFVLSRFPLSSSFNYSCFTMRAVKLFPDYTHI